MATGNQQKYLFTFSIKALPSHSGASIRARKHIFKYLKWLNFWKSLEERLFSMRQHSCFGVTCTHCENSEVQIALFSKWNMVWDWKLVQRFFSIYLSVNKSTENLAFLTLQSDDITVKTINWYPVPKLSLYGGVFSSYYALKKEVILNMLPIHVLVI